MEEFLCHECEGEYVLEIIDDETYSHHYCPICGAKIPDELKLD